MFDITEKDLMKQKAEREAKNMFAKMMTSAILESDAPEYVKLDVQVLCKVKDIHDALEELIVLKYTVPNNEANAETLKTVLEYLELVEVGIKTFSEITPFVKHPEEEE